MKIEWEQHIAGAYSAPLDRVGRCCEIAEGTPIPVAVHLCLVDDAEIHDINRKFRNTDRATDVLSFPMVNYPTGKTAGACEKQLKRNFDPDLGACMLGDVIISVQRAREQAAEYGHSVEREICYLFAHSVFHLMGYDHMEEDERKEMRAMEEKALAMAGIRREDGMPTDEELLILARQSMEKSYSPYSHYPVGAALLCSNGRVYQGCNIENASFGLTNCAERTALFKAVYEGEREFDTIAIASTTAAPYPCGACRQALNEFAPNLRILVTWGEGQVDETDLPTLLPHGFGPSSLDI